MATIYALEGTRDWSSTGSFNTAIDGSGSAGLPQDGDTLIVFGNTYVNAGHTALANIDLAVLDVSGNLTASSTLSFEVSYSGAGVAYIRNRTGRLLIASTNDGIDKLVFSPVSGGAEISLESGTIATVLHQNGRFDVQSSGAVTTYHKSGGTGTFYDGSTAITTANNTGGTWDCRRSVTTLNNYASVVLQGDPAVTTFNNAGQVNDRSSAVHTTLNMNGGLYNPAGSPVVRQFTTLNWLGGNIVTKVGGREILTFGTTNNQTGGSTLATTQIPPFAEAGGLNS